MAALPEIESPTSKVPFNEKLLYTVVALFGFWSCLNFLFTELCHQSHQILFTGCALFSLLTVALLWNWCFSHFTFGMIMQILATANVIRVDYSLKEDRALFCGAQKLFAVLIAFGQAALLVFTGLYGNPTEIGATRCGLLVLQLVFSSSVTMMLDELLQKGYGLGSGINLFVAANVCQTIFWNVLSFKTIPTIRGNEYEGALISLFHLIMSRGDKARALKDAFYRSDLANFMNVSATIVTFAAVIYLQGFRIELPVKSNRLRGQRGNYPIKLFYTSAMPLMLQSALFANIFLFSQALFHYFSNNIIVRILGVWEPIADSNQLAATGGVAYYLSAPHSITAAIFDPIHTGVYVAITIIFCAYLSKVWVDVSGSSSRDVAKTLKDQQLAIAGFRDASMYKELQRVIPVAASFGGAILAIVAVSGDILGAIGSGAGILMTIMIIFQYFEMFVQEQMELSQMMASM
ncbi:unnamed protein product [Mucor hiemalis]